MVAQEKINIKFHQCLVYSQLYEIPEFEAFREHAKAYFAKKYGIDYITIRIVNKDRNLVFFRMDNDKWHEFLINVYKWNFGKLPFLVNNIDTIKPNEIYVEYFDTYMTKITDTIRLRAEIFGERKYGGCEIMISNEVNDIILYSITFKDDKAFGNLMQNVLDELVKDLIRYRDLLTPFARYWEMGGDFHDKMSLTKHLDQFKMDNRSLFVTY